MDIINKINKHLIILDGDLCLNEESNSIDRITTSIKNTDFNKLRKDIHRYAVIFVDFAENTGIDDDVTDLINRNLGTKIKKLRDLVNLKIFEKNSKSMVVEKTYISKINNSILSDIYDFISDNKFSMIANKIIILANDVSSSDITKPQNLIKSLVYLIISAYMIKNKKI